MKEIIDAALAALAAGRMAALVTPVAAEGSLPTGRHARMLVLADGTSQGTVGGGRLEAEAQEAARAAIREGKPRLVRFSLTAKDAREDGLLCGGRATFYVEPLHRDGAAALAAMRELIGRLQPGVEAVLLAEGGPAGRLVAGADGTAAGSLGQAALDRAVLARAGEVIEADSAAVEVFEVEGAPVQVFVQALAPRPTVYLFGGGHVGLALARLIPTIGMRVAVIDDRPEFCSRERFPMADELHRLEFPSAFASLAVDARAYVVIMTPGHKSDREVLTQALRSPAGYIGMIGSRRKIALLWEALEQEGFTRAELARVHAPIGLDLGGDSPGEIAVSVAAQLVQVRHRGTATRR
jgi:xanthine dehydrogenase accessory factor